jgi:ATP-binding cassette subfamily C protein
MTQLRKLAALMAIDGPMRWIAVFVLAAVASGLEAAGALLIYAFLGMVVGVDDALDLPLVGDVRRLLPGLDDNDLLLWAGGLVAVFFVVRALAVLARWYAESRVCETAGARLAQRLFGGYLAMPYRFHLRRSSPELLRNVHTTVDQLVIEVFRPSVKLVSEGLILAGFLLVLLLLAPLETMVVVLVLGPLVYLFLRSVYPRLRVLGESSQRLNRTTIRSVQQSLEGIRDIKLLGREGYFEREFSGDRFALGRVRAAFIVLSEFPAAALETLMVLAMIGFLAAAVVIQGTAAGAIPVLGLFGYAALRLRPSLDQIIRGVTSLRFAGRAIDDAVADLREVAAADAQADDVTVAFTREIRLEHVFFRYEGGAHDTLRDVDLRIRRGESIGIIGPTGGGKSTLVDMIVGLLEPTRGALTVDGADVRGRLAGWHRQVAMVPQNLFLIDDTLRRNIALGVPDREIDEAQVRGAVGLAQLEQVIAGLPDGLDTVVGERGVRLSGGQRQRVAIARGLYRRPQVLVMDEGTSALDDQTEEDLLRAIEGLREHHTLITVAHRLTTVRSCDRILSVNDGVVSVLDPPSALALAHVRRPAGA